MQSDSPGVAGGREVKPYSPQQGVKPTFFPGMDTYISFDPSTQEGGEMLVACQLEEIPDLIQLAGKDVYIANVMCHPAQSVNRNTAEVDEWIRTVIFDAEGKMYSCGSAGVLKSLEI